ncbi:unnamed protein product [Closterium sp. NIES-53]
MTARLSVKVALKSPLPFPHLSPFPNPLFPASTSASPSPSPSRAASPSPAPSRSRFRSPSSPFCPAPLLCPCVRAVAYSRRFFYAPITHPPTPLLLWPHPLPSGPRPGCRKGLHSTHPPSPPLLRPSWLQKGPLTSDVAIGQGHTTAWKLCGLDVCTSLAVLFEIVPAQQQQAQQQAAAQGLQNPGAQQFHLQFTTSYKVCSREDRSLTPTPLPPSSTPPPSPQPTLTAYSFNSPPEPALLDVAAIAVDRILLLDAFFSVVIFHGSTIAQWRNAGYHNQPEHQAFAQLLQAPQADAAAIIAERFPVPRLVDCDQNGSQVRRGEGR